MSLGNVVQFAENMTAGRGWIAVVAVMLGLLSSFGNSGGCDSVRSSGSGRFPLAGQRTSSATHRCRPICGHPDCIVDRPAEFRAGRGGYIVNADEIIGSADLEPLEHEGGMFRQTYVDGQSTAIYFLVHDGEFRPSTSSTHRRHITTTLATLYNSCCSTQTGRSIDRCWATTFVPVRDRSSWCREESGKGRCRQVVGH